MAGTHPLNRLESLVLIAVGGFAGSNLRYLVGSFVPGAEGTLLVNTLGSFLLGFVVYEALFSTLLADRTRTVLGTGFLSSFTTYSTFAVQSIALPGWLLVANVVGTYGCGFVGVLLGRALAKRVEGEDR
jgi:fluoride exporter